MLKRMLSALLVLLSVAPLSAQSDHPRVRHEMLVSTEWLADHLRDPGLVIMCVGLMAARAYFTLDYLGVADRASLLDGGLEKWSAEHRELSTDSPAVTPGKLHPSPHPAILVETSAMRELVANKSSKVSIIDARPLDEFSGAKLSEDVPKAGHIPGAKGLYWMNNLVSPENPVLRPEAELRRLYESMDPGADNGVVTYCRTGMQSSFSYFVAKYLGYDAKMYDASFYEWSRQELPVEK